MGKVIAVANQKGGVAKTTTTFNLGYELKEKGKRVLLIDYDPQGNLSLAAGINNEEVQGITELMQLEREDDPLPEIEDVAIKYHGLDIIPSNLVLATEEINLVNATCREYILKAVIDEYRDEYDYVLIDCGPTLGMLLINALTAADSVLIPVEPTDFSIKGLSLLLESIARTKRKLNKRLQVEGIIFTKVDTRTNVWVSNIKDVKEVYGALNIFETKIPLRVAAEKANKRNVPIREFNKKDDSSIAYERLAMEVMNNE